MERSCWHIPQTEEFLEYQNWFAWLKNISKRLQIQERMTKNIADELYSQGVKGVAVIAEAEHLCMKMRGVRNDANVTSAAFRGIYETKEEKANIIKLIKKSSQKHLLYKISEKINNQFIRLDLW